MPKCFMTGMEIRLEDAFILDRREAYLALREIRGKLKALERIIAELGEVDKVELPDRRTGKTYTRAEFRMVCVSVAQALSAIWSDKHLFIRWSDWKAQRNAAIRELKYPKDIESSEPETTHEESGNGAGA